MDPWVCVGKITAAHGIKGQVKIRFFEDPEWVVKAEPIVNAKHQPILFKKFFIKSPTLATVTIEGVNTRNDAELLKGTELFVHQDQLLALADDEIADNNLLGLTLFIDQKPIGIVVGVYDFGAGSFCEIETPTGKIGTAHLSSCTIHPDRLECDSSQFLI